MNDIERAQIIYKLKEGFNNVTDEMVSLLLNEIGNPEIVNKFEKICRGL